MSYLVDSDVLIDALRGQGNAMSTLGRLAPHGLSISIISLGELYDGVTRDEDTDEHVRKLRQFLDGFKIIGLSEETMMIFGNLRSRLRRQGNLIADLDMLIASTAIRYELELITRNLRHFNRIEELTIYSGNAD